MIQRKTDGKKTWKAHMNNLPPAKSRSKKVRLAIFGARRMSLGNDLPGAGLVTEASDHSSKTSLSLSLSQGPGSASLLPGYTRSSATEPGVVQIK